MTEINQSQVQAEGSNCFLDKPLTLCQYRTHKHEAEKEVGNERGGGGKHRGAGIFQSVKAGGEETHRCDRP